MNCGCFLSTWIERKFSENLQSNGNLEFRPAVFPFRGFVQEIKKNKSEWHHYLTDSLTLSSAACCPHHLFTFILLLGSSNTFILKSNIFVSFKWRLAGKAISRFPIWNILEVGGSSCVYSRPDILLCLSILKPLINIKNNPSFILGLSFIAFG